MDTILKRVMAYIIDILIISIIATMISTISIINPYRDNYEKSYEEYTDAVSQIQEEGSGVDQEENKEEIISLYYNVNKYNVIRSGISIVCTILYFAVLQFIMNGQTIGKKIMKIRIVSNNEAKKLNIGNYLIRSVILNNVIFSLLFIVGIYLFTASGYYSYSMIVSYLQMLVLTIIMLMVVLRKDFRGLHDFLAGTKVIDLNPAVIEDADKEEIKILDVKENKTNDVKKKKRVQKKVENKSTKAKEK